MEYMHFARIALPLAIAVTFLSCMIYVVAQQSLRQSFDDTQIRTAEDTAALILAGAQPATVIPVQSVDIENSITPWVAIYSASGTVVASNGRYRDALPQPPAGVFTEIERPIASTSPVEEKRTWQPTEGVREGLVIVTAGENYVVAGRNLRELEDRIWNIALLITLGWFLTLATTLLAAWLAPRAEDFITYGRD